MRKFKTGATRDADTTKLDIEGFLSPAVIERYCQYLHKHRIQADGKLRDSDNWQKMFGDEHFAVCMKSAFRHFMDVWLYHRGFRRKIDLEESICATLFNLMAYLFKILKDKSEFHKNKYKADGLVTECKPCKKLSDSKSHFKNRKVRLRKMRLYQKENKEVLHIKAIQYSRSEHGRQIRLRNSRKYYWKHKTEISRRVKLKNKREKQKYVAHYQLGNALKLGWIIRPLICQECGEEKPLEGHHPDYTKPFEVIWLCKRCHGKLSRKEETLVCRP